MNEISLTTPSGDTAITVGGALSAGLGNLDPSPVLLVDENVFCQHHDLFSAHSCITVPSGEQYKTLQTVETIYRELVQLEVDRSSLLVGVGGGLATDVAGFVASTYLREVQFGFISTTLLGQVDASIGGKNGVNLDGYKNMIGTIRQPAFVWCDLSLLNTLAQKEYISGIAEVIKYGAILDAGFLHYLSGPYGWITRPGSCMCLRRWLPGRCKAKAGMVEQDEKESGRRRVLNFGHTIGHAIERDKKVLHGEAVAVGMVMAARLSVNLGLLTSGEADRLTALIRAAGLPVDMSLNAEVIFGNIRKDKKKSGKEIHLVLLEGLGNAVVRTVPLKEFKSMLHDLC